LNESILAKVAASKSATTAITSTSGSDLPTEQRKRVAKNPSDVILSRNPEKTGFIKQYDMSELASSTFLERSHPSFNPQTWQRIARIYQPQARHLQDTPARPIGDMWSIEFESFGNHRSQCNHWNYDSNDTYFKHKVKCHSLAAAMDYCNKSGWGYDVLLPRFKYHTRKAYAENFKYKGDYVEPPQED